MTVFSFLSILRSFGQQEDAKSTSKLIDDERTKLLPTVQSAQRKPQEQKGLTSAIDNSTKHVVGVLLEQGIPGMSICVSKRNEIVWTSSFGFSDVENQVVCRPDARFRVGSISKALFASTVIAPMLEKDQLKLDSSIHDFLKEEEFPKQKFANKVVDITVKQLLSHTSGIRHYEEDNYKYDSWKLMPVGFEGSLKVYQGSSQFDRTGFYQRETFRSVIEALKPIKDGRPLIKEPGTYSYTTYGYTVLSAVAEKIIQKNSGNRDDGSSNKGRKQIEDFWIKQLKTEWLLKETELDIDEPILPNRVRYYMRTGLFGRLINAPYTDNSVKWAGGGIISTAGDMIKFALALIDSYKNRETAKLKQETVALLWKEVKESYGLGFMLKKLDPQTSAGEKSAVYHTGSSMGSSSVLMIYPETEVAVAILTNLASINLEPLARFVANEFANCVVDCPKENELETKTLK